MALVRHDTTDGSFHYDWFLAGESVARTLRSDERLDQLSGAAETQLVAVADHRLLYLHLAEPVELSGGRGIVTPIAQGSWRAVSTQGGSKDELIEVRWGCSDSIHTLRITCDARLISLSPQREH